MVAQIRSESQCRFIENQDFIKVYTQSGVNPKGGRPGIDYWLTLDMAKHLAMLDNNEMGDEARSYFLNCEKQLQEKHKQEQPALPAPVIKERILLWLENGQVKHTTTVPDNAYIATPDQLPEAVAKALPGMKLINRHAFERIEELHEGIKASLSFAQNFSADMTTLARDNGLTTTRITSSALTVPLSEAMNDLARRVEQRVDILASGEEIDLEEHTEELARLAAYLRKLGRGEGMKSRAMQNA